MSDQEYLASDCKNIGLMHYHIEQTNDRLKNIEEKLEQLINFRMMLFGGAATISAIISLIFVYLER